MIVVRIVLILLGAVGLFFFVAPIFRRVFNFGTVAGILMSLACLALGICEKQIAALIARCLQHGSTTLLFLFLVILLGFVVAMLAFTATRILMDTNNPPEENSSVIVLGCQVKGTKPSRTLEERIEAAARYLKDHPEAMCIASGGKGRDERISEASCIRAGLIERGIDGDRILMEEKSTTTRENLIFSRRILERRNLPTNLAIVTNEFHECRAQEIAERLDLNAGAVPARTYFLLLPTFFVREQFAMLAEMIHG